LNPEWTPLARGLVVVLVTQLHFAPDPIHQQPVKLPHIAIRHVDELVPEVDDLRPILVVLRKVADLYLVDQRVAPLLLHQRLHAVRLVGPHEVLRQCRIDDLQSRFHGQSVVGCAIPAEQILQHIHRHRRAKLELPHQLLADHLAGKYLADFPVQCVLRFRRQATPPRLRASSVPPRSPRPPHECSRSRAKGPCRSASTPRYSLRWPWVPLQAAVTPPRPLPPGIRRCRSLESRKPRPLPGPQLARWARTRQIIPVPALGFGHSGIGWSPWRSPAKLPRSSSSPPWRKPIPSLSPR